MFPVRYEPKKSTLYRVKLGQIYANYKAFHFGLIIKYFKLKTYRPMFQIFPLPYSEVKLLGIFRCWKDKEIDVRSEVVNAVTAKVTVFRDVTSRSLVDTNVSEEPASSTF
jgi:hypothetical protein